MHLPRAPHRGQPRCRGGSAPLAAPRSASAPPPRATPPRPAPLPPPSDSCALGFATVDHDAPDAATVLTVEAPDYPGLVRVLAWALGGLGVAVDNARLTTTADGLAVNTFWLLDARTGTKLERDRADLLAERVADVVTVCAPPTPSSHATRFVSGGGRVTVDNAAHPSLTVVTVGPAGARCGGGDSGDAAPPPLLDVASAVSGAGLEIREAVVRGRTGGPASTDGVEGGAVKLWVAEAGAGDGKLPPARCAALAYTLELALCGGGGAGALTAPMPGVGSVQAS